ncbi:MAG: hypothetical protein M1831_001311 [Alyxoria varia]|nr:MAG: hypothetical protein M1831_001311 [Alyxoria varia]
MDSIHILELQRRLTSKGIGSCFVGELALNYYNVPRVIHDLEICVPAAKLNEAVSAVVNVQIGHSHKYVKCDWAENEINTYVDYKVPFPRIRCINADPGFKLSIIPDEALHMNPLQDAIVKSHPSHAQYSPELVDFFPDSRDLKDVNLPRLAPFLNGFLRKFVASGFSDYNLASWAELLVDGCDLDEAWCKKRLTEAGEEEKAFAMGRVRSKSGRLDYLHPDGPTCFVHNAEEARMVRCIPGRE